MLTKLGKLLPYFMVEKLVTKMNSFEHGTFEGEPVVYWRVTEGTFLCKSERHLLEWKKQRLEETLREVEERLNKGGCIDE